MPQIKPNALVIKASLKTRGNYTIAGHPGLHLASRGDGTGSWRLKYRPHGSTSQRWHTLSNDARNASFDDVVRAKDRWLAQVKHDKVDPKKLLEAEARAAAAAKLTLSTVIDEWIALPRPRTLRPRTVKLYRWIFDSYIVPAFGHRPIVEIEKAELAEHFSSLRDRLQREGGRDGTGTRGEMAGKAFTYLFAVYEHATDQEYLPRNPMRGLVRPVPKESDQKASRPLRPEELRRLWPAIDKHASAAMARMIKLALLLGRRRAEIAGAEVDELHLDETEPYWLVRPREGNKSALPSLVPLPKVSVVLFKEALGARGASGFVFPQHRGEEDKPTSPDALSRAWREVCEAVGVPDEVTLHSARSLLTDNLERMGVPDNIVSHVLHHTADMRGTTAKRVYSSNQFRSEKLDALTRWEAELLRIVHRM